MLVKSERDQDRFLKQYPRYVVVALEVGWWCQKVWCLHVKTRQDRPGQGIAPAGLSCNWSVFRVVAAY